MGILESLNNNEPIHILVDEEDGERLKSTSVDPQSQSRSISRRLFPPAAFFCVVQGERG